MADQTKNIITRAWVENELRFYHKAGVRSTVVLFAIVLPLTILLCACIGAALSEFEFHIIGKLIITLPLIATAAFAIWKMASSVYALITQGKQLANGEFEVAVREVQYKEERRGYRHSITVLEFADFSEVEVDPTTYELADRGDAYYLVHYTGKREVKLYYALEMYEYRER